MRPAVIGRRALSGLLVLVGVSILAFSLVHLLPGDTAHAIAGEYASPEQVERVRVELGLDKPIVVQYFSWLFGVLRGDFGTSLWTGGPALAASGLALLALLPLGQAVLATLVARRALKQALANVV